MYYVKYYSKRSRDPFRGRVPRKAPRKPKTTKYPNIPWVDIVPTGNSSKSGPKPLRKALKASVKGPLRKHKFNKTKALRENAEAFNKLKGWKKLIAGVPAYGIKAYMDWAIANADEEGHSPVYNYIAKFNPGRKRKHSN